MYGKPVRRLDEKGETMSSSEIASSVAGWGALVILLACIVFLALIIIARWKIFTKAGQAGWKSIIPVLGDYTQWKIAWKKTGLFWVMFILCIAAGVLLYFSGYPIDQLYHTSLVSTTAPAIDPSTMNMPALYGFAACSIIAGILELVCMYKLFKSFGHGVGWFILYLLFSSLMIIILGLGSSRYQGARD